MQNNILLAVDDKAENLYILNELVVENLPDCHLLMTTSAEEGLAIASEKNVDGVILDVQMPRIDGMEMCRRLKANARTAHIPVVLITAHKSSPELRARCLEAGADDFISKPIGSVELVAKIKVLLRIKKAEDNLRAFNAHLEEMVEERTRALQEQTRLNKIFLDSMPCVALLIRPITREIAAANRMAIDRGAIPGTQCFKTWRKLDAPCPWCLCPELWNSGEPQHREVEHQGVIWDTYWISLSDDLYLHYAFDITEKRHLEEQLLQAQKLDALGTLSGGIAHDFNNILAAIIGYTQLAQRLCNDRSKEYEYLDMVMKASDRAESLVGQILAFSRKSETEKHPFSIASAIKEGLKLLRATLPATIEIKYNIDCDSTVMGDLNQIHQILMNLCTNAAHAMRENGGLLEISLTEREIQENKLLQFSELPPGKYVCLTVKDNGTGIDPLIRDRIFDPFFTTKDKSQGTGLGLSVVLGIVKDHKGGIQLDSVPGQGTVFRVYLPVCGGAEKKQEENHSLHRGNREWILFADDEEILRNLGKKMLETLNYQIVVCVDGKDALETFLRDSQKFSLVMTDQTMPRMTGMQLTQEILSKRPDIPILLYTGYDERVTFESAASIGIRQVLMKPLDIVHLSNSLDKLLSAKS